MKYFSSRPTLKKNFHSKGETGYLFQSALSGLVRFMGLQGFMGICIDSIDFFYKSTLGFMGDCLVIYILTNPHNFFSKPTVHTGFIETGTGDINPHNSQSEFIKKNQYCQFKSPQPINHTSPELCTQGAGRQRCPTFPTFSYF